MNVNTALLKSFIIKNSETQKELAAAMGLSLSTLNAKINGKACFRQNEINFIRDRYCIDPNDLVQVFFAEKVS